ncbi:glycerol-3-phosphate 1-O-acyltransferase PlsY [Thiovibrio frasassiensis]|jgi:glycerol-3-phosphate acyltransferase PlsY|uniref:Glycerol-3-phosphate acyltransferase n=1 Tax=Thiovibrio frasassiensis TaxID=2984131 RepID=A0A9X4MHV1_9BACT|nr:glycerol-3-phosphate 1-O-acyltransferase PlsY [Thiovibrio frasassiensis]MDG4475828.1 glycerol-3-phosphate 1-O-acyltransferase PlsY [Thiovibrio frasassiensis]
MEYLLVIGSYLIGSIPFGLVLGKVAGVDVRAAGSGNIGATNVARLVGKKVGALTLVCDALKGILPMLVAGWLLADGSGRELWVPLCGGAAFLGHLYPLYLKFKGGKGVATALGIFLYLTPVAALIDLLIFVGVVYNWGYVSLGSLTAALLMPGLVWLLTGSLSNSLLAFGIGVLIWVKHRENIERLMKHEEKSWRKKDGDSGNP